MRKYGSLAGVTPAACIRVIHARTCSGRMSKSCSSYHVSAGHRPVIEKLVIGIAATNRDVELIQASFISQVGRRRWLSHRLCGYSVVRRERTAARGKFHQVGAQVDVEFSASGAAVLV